MCNSHIAEDAGGLQNPTAEAGCIEMKSWDSDCVDAIQVVEHHDIRKRAFEHFSPNRAFLSQNGQIPTKNGQTSKKRARAKIYVTKGSPGRWCPSGPCPCLSNLREFGRISHLLKPQESIARNRFAVRLQQQGHSRDHKGQSR